MSKIRSTNTKSEIVFRKALWKIGFRYRLNLASLPGKPDIVLNKYKIVIFIDGEFWHGYNWEKKKETIKANRPYWVAKIEKNISRDEQNNTILQNMGYKVIRFWESEVKKELDLCISKVLAIIER